MKKLILIVILAVVASKALSDRDEHRNSNDDRWSVRVLCEGREVDQTTGRPIGVHRPRAESFAPPQSPEPPSLTRTVGGDDPNSAAAPPPPRGHRSKRRSQANPTPAPKVVSLLAPDPASKVAPAWFPKGEWEEEGLARPDTSGIRVLLGRLSVSVDRAKDDLRKTVNREIADWLAADVPMTWTPPQKLVDRMIQSTYVQTVLKSLGPKPGEITPDVASTSSLNVETLPELDDLHTLYRAGQKIDFSEARRSDFIERYHRDVASTRMRKMGTIGAVVLAALGLISLYIRTDEATKGYYTNRLRVLAAAGLGVAGTLAYRYWA